MGLNLMETGGGEWLTEGRYITRIVKQKPITANTGSRGVEYEFVEDSTGHRAKGSYWMYAADRSVSPGAWRLRQLAKSAGLDEDSLRDFQPSMLMGKTVGVIVEKDGKYHVVQGEFPPDEQIDAGQSVSEQSEANEPDSDGEGEVKSDGAYDPEDDVPF